MARPFEYQNCVLQKEVRLKTVRLISADVSEGSLGARRSEAFALAIDSFTNTPHAVWKSMLSGDCEPRLCFYTSGSHRGLAEFLQKKQSEHVIFIYCDLPTLEVNKVKYHLLFNSYGAFFGAPRNTEETLDTMNRLCLWYNTRLETETLYCSGVFALFSFSLINSAEPQQFTVALILPPSAVPKKHVIAHLFILSAVSLKIIFVKRLAKAEHHKRFKTYD